TLLAEGVQSQDGVLAVGRMEPGEFSVDAPWEMPGFPTPKREQIGIPLACNQNGRIGRSKFHDPLAQVLHEHRVINSCAVGLVGCNASDSAPLSHAIPPGTDAPDDSSL